MSKRRNKRKSYPKRVPPAKEGAVYRQLWRVVDGAICDAFNKHPDYLTYRGACRHTARRSIAKRVTGAVMGYALQLAPADAQSRSGDTPAADTACSLPSNASLAAEKRCGQGEFLTGARP